MSDSTLQALENSINTVYCIKDELSNFKQELHSIKDIKNDYESLDSAYSRLLKINEYICDLKGFNIENLGKLGRLEGQDMLLDLSQKNAKKKVCLSSSQIKNSDLKNLLSTILPKQTGIGYKKGISGYSLFRFLKEYREKHKDTEIYLENMEMNSGVYVEFQLGTAICMSVDFAVVEEKSISISNCGSNPSLQKQSEEIERQEVYKINAFHVFKFGEMDFDTTNSPAFGPKIKKRSLLFDLIQNQVNSRWNSSFIELRSEIQNLAEIMDWFACYSTLFSRPCDFCSAILKYEPTVGQWVPPVVRIKPCPNRDTTEFDGSIRGGLDSASYSALHFSCA